MKTRKIKAIICDGDGTLWSYKNEPFHSSWDAMGDCLDAEKRKKWYLLRDFYYKRKEDYTKWFHEQIYLLNGVTLEHLKSKLFPIPYSIGVEDFFQSLNRKYKTGILTLAADFIAERAKIDLSLDFFVANYFFSENGILTGKAEEKVALWGKENWIKKIVDNHKISDKEICYIGDNDNDISCLKYVGLPIAFNPKTEETAQAAKYVIHDFRELKKLL